jgi:hypothetical protein
LQGLLFEDSLLNAKRLPHNIRATLRKSLIAQRTDISQSGGSGSGCQPDALKERAIKKSISVSCVYHREVSIAGEVCKSLEKCFQLSHRTRAELYAAGEHLRNTCPRSSHVDWSDAHLGNFLGFAMPWRRIIFDIHDLDETIPAPWEWDLKRFVASFVVAWRDDALGNGIAEDAVLSHGGDEAIARKEARIEQANNPHAIISDGLAELNNPGVDLIIIFDDFIIVKYLRYLMIFIKHH